MRTRRRNYTTATQPSTLLPEALTVKAIVPKSDTKRIHSCNAKGKGTKSKKKKKCITRGLWDLHIPTEILEGILSRLGLKDNIQASAVCKTWCVSAVSVRKVPYRPWLLYPRDDWSVFGGSPYHLLDLVQSQKYKLIIPNWRYKPGGISYSRDGRLLSKTADPMYAYFFNPFTKKLVYLPRGSSFYHSDSRLAFSAAPTSTSCVVISYVRLPRTGDFMIETWQTGDATWTTHPAENSVRMWDKCVFSNGLFYFLSTCGCLGVFDTREATWNLLPVKPFLFLEEELDSSVFIMEHEGDIFAVCSRLKSNNHRVLN